MTKKTEKIVALYNVLKDAKLTKMEDADKYSVIKILRKLRPVAEKFDADRKDASERLKTEELDGAIAKYQQWQSEGEKCAFIDDEKREIVSVINDYDRKVRECIAEELDVDVEVELPKLSESAFKKLLASNDWNAEVAMFVADELVEE